MIKRFLPAFVIIILIIGCGENKKILHTVSKSAVIFSGQAELEKIGDSMHLKIIILNNTKSTYKFCRLDFFGIKGTTIEWVLSTEVINLIAKEKKNISLTSMFASNAMDVDSIIMESKLPIVWEEGKLPKGLEGSYAIGGMTFPNRCQLWLFMEDDSNYYFKLSATDSRIYGLLGSVVSGSGHCDWIGKVKVGKKVADNFGFQLVPTKKDCRGMDLLIPVDYEFQMSGIKYDEDKVLNLAYPGGSMRRLPNNKNLGIE